MASRKALFQATVRPYVPWLLLALCVGFLMTICILPGASLAFDSEPTRDFNDQWMWMDENGATHQMPPLPARIETTQRVCLTKILPEDVSHPAVLGFRSAHQRVRLYCGETLIYSFGYDEKTAFGNSPGAAWNLVRLPQNCEGQTLRLELDSPYAFYQGKIPDMQIGSKASLLFSILRQYLFALALTLLIFVIGVATLLVYFLIIRKDEGIGKEMLYLGLFAVFIACWLFGECRLTQFFGIPPAFNTCFTFVAMWVTPIPLIHYIACSCSHPKRRALLALTARLLSLLLMASILLQALDLLDFIQQLVMIHSCLIASAFVMLYVVIRDVVQHRTPEQLRLLISLSVLAFFFLFETILLYFRTQSVGGMMRIGVLAFIGLQAYTAFTNASRMLKLSRLATVDALTGCFNRTAYAQSLEEVQEQESIGVVIADINNLKMINDTYGHDVGDDAIVRCASCFTKAFSTYGRCFRIGGDEFAMLGAYLSEERLCALEAEFEALTIEEDAQTPYPFRVSYGHTLCDLRSDTSLADAVRRADKVMYAHKRRTKQRESDGQEPHS